MPLRSALINHVRLNALARPEASYGREGTAFISVADFAQRFGEPHEKASADDKVTAAWYVRTPRGVACVRDYWWNDHNEMSIAGHVRACQWLAAWLRGHDIDATACSWQRTRPYYATQ